MKLRNQLLALCCLLVFAAFGFLYVRNTDNPEPTLVCLDLRP